MYKDEARHMVHARLEYWNLEYGFTYKRVSIRNQKTRWGSCSSQGNLNFNYRVIFLPKELVDYIIVHELCHLGELNHSAEFWSLVARALPNYRESRSALRLFTKNKHDHATSTVNRDETVTIKEHV